MKRKTLLFLLFTSFFFTHLLSQNSKVIVKQFDDCESIKDIDLDKIRSNQKSDISLSIVILRGESTHQNGVKTITLIDKYLVPFDSTVIHIYSYELKYTSGSNSCSFKFKINGKSENFTKGVPPFMCLTTSDPILLEYIKIHFDLLSYSKDNRFLLLSRTYENDSTFYSELNKIITEYNSFFILRYLLENKSNVISTQKKWKDVSFGFNIGSY